MLTSCLFLLGFEGNICSGKWTELPNLFSVLEQKGKKMQLWVIRKGWNRLWVEKGGRSEDILTSWVAQEVAPMQATRRIPNTAPAGRRTLGRSVGAAPLCAPGRSASDTRHNRWVPVAVSCQNQKERVTHEHSKPGWDPLHGCKPPLTTPSGASDIST